MGDNIKTVKQAFKEAFNGEAKAALRLKVYAEKAEDEGYPQVAKLFRVVSFSETAHATRSLRMMNRIRSTQENLEDSFESECHVAEVAYEKFARLADQEGDRMAQNVFTQAKDVEEVHGKLYKEAMNHLMEDRDTTYYVCTVCGYVSDGIFPDSCPICGAPKEKFVEFQ